MKCHSVNFNQNQSSTLEDANCEGTFDQCKKVRHCNDSCFLLWEISGTRVSAGCGLKSKSNDPNDPDHCASTCVAKEKAGRYYCCCTGDLCNYNYTVPFSLKLSNISGGTTKALPIANQATHLPSHWSPLFPALFVILGIVIAGLIIFKKLSKKKHPHGNQNEDDNQLNQSMMVPMMTVPHFEDHIQNNHHHHHHHIIYPHGLEIHNKETNLNGSKIGDVKLLEILGRGRFGIVHRAYINDKNKDSETQEEVAVKVTKVEEYESWQNERFVYQSHGLKHPNILNYLYSDEHVETNTYWIIVEYAPLGSLCSYLRENIIGWQDFLNMALGIVRGLNHLHDAHIAHRDFKSTNILLKQDLTPCITDFGVAKIFQSPNGSHVDKKKYHQVGTPRYMAPEVLECNIVFTQSSILKIDVYALSLVLWELLSRTILPTVGEYLPPAFMLPFEDIAGKNPSIERMVQIVVHEKQRPSFREEWASHPRLGEFCKTVLKEGWDTDFDSRSTACCLLERVTHFVDRESMTLN